MKRLVWFIVLILFLLYQLRFEGFNCWGSLEKKDYWGNDINHYASITLAQCKQKCVDSATCVGIGRSVNEDSIGHCWIKNKWDTGTPTDGRWSYKLVRDIT